MMKRSRTLLAAALFASLAPLAFADIGASDTPPAPDPARPAVGEWIGGVSWSEHVVTYAWRIDPDGTFSSGRLGRGYNGGGTWHAHGARVTLKYDDGFRYEGELAGNAYGGMAYGADGRVFGGFSMSRDMKRVGETDAYE